MKNIKSFDMGKYATAKTRGLFKKSLYIPVEDGIYQMNDEEKLYVTTLSFEQEPEYEEGADASDISQYPLEDILDKYLCHLSDFYEDKNVSGTTICYLEFASPNLKNVQELRDIIGKHVYNKDVEEDGQVYSELVIE